MRAFVERVRTCRGDYSVGSEGGLPFALTRNGVRLSPDVLAPGAKQDVLQAHANACACAAQAG